MNPAVNGQCRGCGEPIAGASFRPRAWCSDACRKRHEREWIPKPGTNRSTDAVQRRKLIRAWAAQGYSSHQMSERLGMRDADIRRIAKTMRIEMPADAILHKTRRPDSAHIVQETVLALEGLAMGIGLVSLDELDPAQAQDWAASLTVSIRDLDRFVKTMKEYAQ